MTSTAAKTETTVLVGLSGGVDSSVTALLLRQQGYRVHGMFMKNWVDVHGDGQCPIAEDLEDARAVSESLGIPFHSINFAPEYWDRVFSHFLAEHRAGRTPNPDILCNREVKFDLFLNKALEMGADFMATGHYARIEQRGGYYRLLKGVDPNKDQSYFLYTLGQEQLARSLFPLGGLHKEHVRRLAAEAGLRTHAKKDSTGICFIGERNFADFLSHYLPPSPGPIETPEGRCVGEHQGLMYYTLGQRKGLHIGGRKDSEELPWFVVGKKVAENVLVVAQGHDHPLLHSQRLTAVDLSWTRGHMPRLPLRCKAKTRYRQPEQPCTLEELDAQGRLKVCFEQPQRAMTPGQSVVFYRDDECLGGGVIDHVEGIIYT